MNTYQKFAHYYSYRKAVFWFLVALSLSAFIWYGYAISNAVWNTVRRQEIEENLSALRSKVGDLQARAISMRGDITLQLAKELGFEETAVTFITRQPLGSGISSANEI